MHDGISGAITGGVNAFKSALDPFAQPPTSAAALGNAGGPPLPMVSQDERSSIADRTGIPSPTQDTSVLPTTKLGLPPDTTPAGTTPAAPVPPADPYAIPPAIRAGIFKGESGGDYNTLYGHMERQGPFAGTKLTNMTLDQALQFNSPQGAYGQWAAKNGIAAAPLGAYQIVHRTGLLAKEGLGLSGSEQFTPALQEKMGGWIYHKQGTGAWAGYHGPGDPNAYAAAPSDSSLPFSPGETLHVPSSRGPGGSGRQSPNVAYGGGQNVTLPGAPEVAGNSYGVTGDGQDNTALAVDPNAAANQRAARMARMQRLAAMGGQGVGPQLPQTRAPMQDQNNPSYQAVKAIQTGHARALPTVNVLQGLAAIGKGYRDNAGSTYG
jgi:hypothetical protein